MTMKELYIKMPNLYDAIQDDMEISGPVIFSDSARVRLMFPDDDTWTVAVQETGAEEIYVFKDISYSNTSDYIAAELRSSKNKSNI
ncbi:MAG: hypothetical protein PHT62_06090 [Desulfotomaculaceae bacterium]|nr:hypothetical protein [Desulfotomaculaceae bacterium]